MSRAERAPESETTPGGAGDHYLPTLDGWRAIAIGWVILGHQQPFRFGWFSNSIFLGTVQYGVDIFFALSGILICFRLLREEQERGKISLRNFYLRRLFRIQPAALAYLAVFALLSLTGIVAVAGKGIAGALLMVRNLWPSEYTGSSWFTAHFWSLAVEEQFYLVLPAFLLFVRRRREAIFVVLFLLLEAWRLFYFHHEGTNGTHALARPDLTAGGIVLGCACAVALRDPAKRAWMTRLLKPWMLFLWMLLLLVKEPFFAWRIDHFLLMCTFPALIVSTLLHPKSITGRILETGLLRFVGLVSYSLYLWQQPFFYVETPPAAHSLRAHTALCWALMVACALVSYYAIERPAIRFGRRRMSANTGDRSAAVAQSA